MRAILALLLLSTPALAEPEMITTRYTCERGIEVPASYVNYGEFSVAVINVEGRQISLYLERSASGARYGWPSDGANYVWWTKGKDATLYWKEGGEETPILSGCVQQ